MDATSKISNEIRSAMQKSLARLIAIHPWRFCVYYHFINGKLIYIGCGRPARAFDPIGRNPIWQKMVKRSGSMQVQIIKWFQHLRRAKKFEYEKIKDLQPVCNIHGNENHKNWHSRRPRDSWVMKLPVNIVAKLRKIAAADHRKLNDMIRVALIESLTSKERAQ
jgi:hypothetical protein